MMLRDTASLITGASRGLGRALASRLAEAGSRVVLVARPPEPPRGRPHIPSTTAGSFSAELPADRRSPSANPDLERAVAEIRAAGGTAHGIAADLGDKDAIYPLAGQAAALVGPIDILINNASELGPTPLRLLGDTECEDLERVLAVNLVGPFRLTKVVAGSMALRQTGVVVNISSDAAVEAYPTWGAYSVSKAALDHLTRVWAAELNDQRVRFLAVDPGEMATQMHADAMPDADPAELTEPDAIARRILAMIESPARARSGSRLVAPDFAPEVTP